MGRNRYYYDGALQGASSWLRDNPISLDLPVLQMDEATGAPQAVTDFQAGGANSRFGWLEP